MTALTRRHVLAGAAATVVAAAELTSFVNPTASPRHVKHAMYIRWDGLWPDEVHPNKVRDGDFYTDHWSNAVWRYETDWIPGWVYLRKIDRSRPHRFRELSV